MPKGVFSVKTNEMSVKNTDVSEKNKKNQQYQLIASFVHCACAFTAFSEIFGMRLILYDPEYSSMNGLQEQCACYLSSNDFDSGCV